jgi:hypothetical protein
MSEFARRLISDGDMSADVTSEAYAIESVVNWSVQFVWSGSPVGTVRVEHSNDRSNWSAITPLNQATGGSSGSHVAEYTGSGLRYVRAKFVHTSGSGTLNAFFFGKGQ